MNSHSRYTCNAGNDDRFPHGENAPAEIPSQYFQPPGYLRKLSIAMKKILILFTLPLYCAAQSFSLPDAAPSLPVLFGEGIISTNLYERDMAIAPDGSELFYSIQVNASGFHAIVHMRRSAAGKWSEPEIAGFSGRYSDLEPAFSGDGKRVYFSSRRPVQAGLAKQDYDIWYSDKVNGIWTEPNHLGAPVNTDADEYYPSVASNGNLYFTASYQKGYGKEDIFLARKTAAGFEEPVPLDTGVNSALYEFNAFVSPAEDFIIFTSYGRKDDQGRGDLYISFKGAGNKWLPAKNMTMLNSDKLDYCPFVSFDRKTLFFTSDRHQLPASYSGRRQLKELSKELNSAQNGSGDIYWISFEKILQELKQN
jgi:hypothetical protein